LLLAGAEVFAEEPGIGDLLIELADATKGAKEELARRNVLRGQYQQASRNVDQLLITVRTLFERLRFIVKGRFGPKAERLVAFGFKPRRPATKPKPIENPPEQVQSAEQAAVPAADSKT
jgi:hypothetical protein